MDFYRISSKKPISGNLVYRINEWSFDFILSEDISNLEIYNQLPSNTNEAGFPNIASLSLEMLQIQIDLNANALLFPWGYHPNIIWTNKTLPQIIASSGIIRFNTSHILTGGASHNVIQPNLWKTFYDSKTGWVCLTQPDDLSFNLQEFTEFADNVIIGLYNSQLQSLWMRPEFI